VVELPGVERNEIKVEAKENTIRISGKKAVKYDDGVSVHRRERLSGEFDRTLSVPVEIEADRINAEYKDGVLSLYLPRAQSAKPRTIPIK
jgi:HSP20 family protein